MCYLPPQQVTLNRPVSLQQFAPPLIWQHTFVTTVLLLFRLKLVFVKLHLGVLLDSEIEIIIFIMNNVMRQPPPPPPRHDFQSGEAKIFKWISMPDITPILLSFGSNHKSNVKDMFCAHIHIFYHEPHYKDPTCRRT